MWTNKFGACAPRPRAPTRARSIHSGADMSGARPLPSRSHFYPYGTTYSNRTNFGCGWRFQAQIIYVFNAIQDTFRKTQKDIINGLLVSNIITLHSSPYREEQQQPNNLIMLIYERHLLTNVIKIRTWQLEHNIDYKNTQHFTSHYDFL